MTNVPQESVGQHFVWTIFGRRPVLVIVLTGLIATVINCYPVLFCGKSFVSPSCAAPLVYQWAPTLPGIDSVPAVFHQGSDTAATMWWCVPMGFVESQSIIRYGEIPLWNRYSHAGDTLIGQGVSMLGDPLHLIVIIGKGTAWSWDIKYLVAKFIFCAGFGLLILRLFENVVLSVVYTALAAYCGAFFYIDIHPVFFVFSYAPWILLSAISMVEPARRRWILWGFVWLVANVGCFNAGFPEVAVDLIGGLNLAAILFVMAQTMSISVRLMAVGRMLLSTLVFLGLTAPMWLSFLATLTGSYTAHDTVTVAQLPSLSLPGVFDDLFYLRLLKNDSCTAIGPCCSLLVFSGFILSLLGWKWSRKEFFFWLNSSAIILWAGVVFGWVPGSLIAKIPLLNRVGHIYTDFSYLLVFHLMIQSAYGFRYLWKQRCFKRNALDCACIAVAFAGMTIAYAGLTAHRPIPWNYFLIVEAGAISAPLLFAYLNNFYAKIPVAGFVGVLILGFLPHFRFGLYHAGDEHFLKIAGPRTPLNAPSAAVDKIKNDNIDPFRVVALDYNLMGDYGAAYELEDIRSCAPLSNAEYINMVRSFPGMSLDRDWMLRVTDPGLAQPLLNMLNVKYLLCITNVMVQDGSGFKLSGRNDFGIVENLQTWPRAFFSDTAVSISSTVEFNRFLNNNGNHPFVALTDNEILNETNILRVLKATPGTISPAYDYLRRPNSTAFSIHATSAGIVCLTEGQAKNFSVTVNGEPKNVLTVNRAFKGVCIDKPGDYRIEFVYRPRYWKLSCGLFLSAFMILVIVAAIQPLRMRGDKKQMVLNHE